MNAGKIKIISGVFLTCFSYLFGGLDEAFVVLMILMVFDYITGMMSAFTNKNLSSKTGFRGILKKLCILIIISLSNLGGEAINLPALRSLAIGFYIANEALSILENSSELGVNYPKAVKDALEQIKKG